MARETFRITVTVKHGRCPEDRGRVEIKLQLMEGYSGISHNM